MAYRKRMNKSQAKRNFRKGRQSKREEFPLCRPSRWYSTLNHSIPSRRARPFGRAFFMEDINALLSSYIVDA